tara:strand:- start:12794 stop:13540 length:747 start_codon:yes stop_codon:yes gene_type:complete
MKKIYLLIQGHTKYCREVLDNVRDVENVIWSTEASASINDLKDINNSNVTLAKSPAPAYAGYGNVNLQINSTVSGLHLAKALGATHVIKIRSDLIFTDPKEFIDTYKFDDRIHQMAYCKHTDKCIPITQHYGGLIPWIQERYSALVEDVNDYNYIADFANLGPIDEMINFWSLPYEDTPIYIPAEFKLVLRYLELKGYKDVSLSYKYFSSLFGFFMTFCKETNNPLISLKNGWTSNDLLKSSDVEWIG